MIINKLGKMRSQCRRYASLMAAGKLSSAQAAVLRLGTSALRRVTKQDRGVARLNVRSTCSPKSIKRNVMMHRKRILKAKKLKRRQLAEAAIKGQSLHQLYDLSECADAGVQPFKKLLSTDSDELEVYGSSEEDPEDSIKQMGAEEDSGCDDWDLSKRALKRGGTCAYLRTIICRRL